MRSKQCIAGGGKFQILNIMNFIFVYKLLENLNIV